MEFTTRDILRITTHYNLTNSSAELFKRLHAIAEFMVGEKLHRYQLLRVADEITPHLIAAFPWADPDVAGFEDGWDDEQIDARLAEIIAEVGDAHEVEPIPPEDHESLSVEEDIKRLGYPKKAWIGRLIDKGEIAFPVNSENAQRLQQKLREHGVDSIIVSSAPDSDKNN